MNATRVLLGMSAFSFLAAPVAARAGQDHGLQFALRTGFILPGRRGHGLRMASLAAIHATLVDRTGATPLMRNHSASVTSNTNSGIHMSQPTKPPKKPTNCTGRPITTSTDATIPSQASGTGTIRPRKRSQEKSVLATAKKVALRPGPP